MNMSIKERFKLNSNSQLSLTIVIVMVIACEIQGLETEHKV